MSATSKPLLMEASRSLMMDSRASSLDWDWGFGFVGSNGVGFVLNL